MLGDRRLLTVENEIAFWKEYFAALLRSQGIGEQIEARAEKLFSAYWLKGITPYPETESVLRWFREHGFSMGVISDTFPSLQLTIEAAGLGAYFDCYVCSDQVGAMKPDPRMYRTALDALNVCAAESLYADDYDVEADRFPRARHDGVPYLPGKRAESGLGYCIAFGDDCISAIAASDSGARYGTPKPGRYFFAPVFSGG